jgi:hypothetical protein
MVAWDEPEWNYQAGTILAGALSIKRDLQTRPSTPLADAWIAVQAASAKEQSAALALENERQNRRSQRALLGLKAQHDAALVVLDDALKALALVQRDTVKLPRPKS